jgi:pimeloyl-ACP methyl ester carboxylesterase
VHDVFGASFPIYMRLFQELDAHSVYHQLPEVSQPTLVISGGIDWLTPASLSKAVARRIPGAEHLQLRLGSHFVLIEQAGRVVDRIESFLAR